MKRTLQQNAQLHTLLTRLDLQEEKADLVYQHTQGRTTRSSEMLYNECASLIGYLNNMVSRKQRSRFDYNDPANRMRRKILSICHEMGWETDSGKIDWPRLNAWLLKYGYLHKGLNDYTAKELPRLVTQFENYLKSVYDAG